MNPQALLDRLQQDPRMRGAIAQAAQSLAAQVQDVAPAQLRQLMRLLEFTLQRPESYPAFLQQAAQSGMFAEGDLPPEFDPVFIGVILLALHMLLQGAPEEQPAPDGGLSQLAQQGRNGDSQLAHINPLEAQMLRAHGGSGTVNPSTGMPEYSFLGDLWKGLRGAVKSVAPVLPLALSFMAPGLGAGIGSALGASGAWAPVAGNALLGGGLSALAGGDALTGALGGAASGALGDRLAGGDDSSGLGLNLKTLSMALPVLGVLGATQQQATPAAAAPARTPAQEEYFNRPLQSLDWDRLSREAAAVGLSPSEYLARNLPRVRSEPSYMQPVVRKAQGGALSKVAYLARGSGSGRADTIDARLSDGEYVMDAETVALLGDGSTQAGAAKLDEMRKQLRRQKGAALARGEFSPDAKSPLAYLKGAA